MRRLYAAAMVTALVLVSAGCASAGPRPIGPASTAGSGEGNPKAFNDRAASVVKVWTDSGMPRKWRTGFVPLQDLTVIGPDMGFDGQSKVAFMNGDFQMKAPLLLPPPPGLVRFPDGTTMKVPLQTEEDAFATIHKGQCTPSECEPLIITDVTLASIKFLTSRGLAKVPAWAFTVEGLKSQIYRVAVAPSHISEIPAAPAADYPDVPSLRGGLMLLSVDGWTITFSLGVGACDKNIKPYVYETDDVIAVGGTANRSEGVCPAILKTQPETVTLDRPVDGRAILDAKSGQPLTLAPVR